MRLETPSYLKITDCLKATPVEEAGERFVYIEASNESRDQQGEIVLAKALEESADYYLKFGNIDIDHYTQIGAKAGIPDYSMYEIGQPVEVNVRDGSTFVKGQIFQGEGPAADRANQFWDSLTKITPSQRWYPSVGGAVLAKSEEVQNGKRTTFVEKVRWSNIGFSKTPVNDDVATVATIPFEALSKSFVAGHGYDISKALTAGYGTDSASLSGGGALRKQSLHGSPINYWDFRDSISGSIRNREISNPTARKLIDFASSTYGISQAEAAEWVERFMRDVKQNLKR